MARKHKRRQRERLFGVLRACVLRTAAAAFGALIVCFCPSILTAAERAKTAPALKPLDKIEILAWSDFGTDPVRLSRLVQQAGIDFHPTPEYLRLLQETGVHPDLVQAVAAARLRTGSAEAKPAPGARAKPTPVPISSRGGGADAAESAAGDSQQGAAFAHLATCMKLGAKAQWGAAETECEAATTLEPGVTFFALGDIRLREGKCDTALDAFRRAEQSDNALAPTHDFAGLASDCLTDPDGAEKEYREAIRLDPGFAAPHNHLAALYLHTGDLDKAEKETRESLKIDPDSAAAHHIHGLVRFKMGDANGATVELRKAAALEPDAYYHHASLAEVLAMRRKLDEAIPEFRQALALQPRWAQGHAELAATLMDTHQTSQARGECAAAERVAAADSQIRRICEPFKTRIEVARIYPEALAQLQKQERGDATQHDAAASPNVEGHPATQKPPEGNYAEALKSYQERAQRGDAGAALMLGAMNLTGVGAKQNSQDALAWLHKAAEGGYAYADFLIGWMHQEGYGATLDASGAFSWMKRGAVRGDVRAQAALARMYANGFGTSRDEKQALEWYRKAAEQGDAAAAYGVAMRFLDGQGVAKDYSEAERWLTMAANNGDGDASLRLAQIYGGVFPGMAGAPDDAKAAKYLQIAANQGVSDAQCLLGRLYAAGQGVMQDKVAAYEWMLLASEYGTEQCERELKTLALSMTLDRVAEAKRRAAAWSPQVAPDSGSDAGQRW